MAKITKFTKINIRQIQGTLNPLKLVSTKLNNSSLKVHNYMYWSALHGTPWGTVQSFNVDTKTGKSTGVCKPHFAIPTEIQ